MWHVWEESYVQDFGSETREKLLIRLRRKFLLLRDPQLGALAKQRLQPAVSGFSEVYFRL
jgi:hypothetical protein